tara:strand:- start:471 stop:1454 length:984 start_codon:yes stop_codon:yes gene_type:complete
MNSIIGFNEQFDLLKSQYNENILHSSIIIHGPKGIGKRLFVNNFINEIFKNKFENTNFNHHYNLLENNTHPNVKIIDKSIDLKTKKLKLFITIDQIRNLKKFLNESSSIDNLDKFIIIDSADDLNINSANSFLKNLEEPKNNTFIFLITHQLSSLLPTIRSRCLKIKFNKHNFNNFNIILSEKLNTISEEEIKFLFDLTYGSPGIAISLYESEILDTIDITLKSLESSIIDKYKVEISNIVSNFDNEKFKSYLSIIKSLLMIINKLKNDSNYSNIFLSDKLKSLNNTLNSLNVINIIDRFDFLINNERDLFTYNLDKKIFMLKFLTN